MHSSSQQTSFQTPKYGNLACDQQAPKGMKIKNVLHLAILQKKYSFVEIIAFFTRNFGFYCFPPPPSSAVLRISTILECVFLFLSSKTISTINYFNKCCSACWIYVFIHVTCTTWDRQACRHAGREGKFLAVVENLLIGKT